MDVEIRGAAGQQDIATCRDLMNEYAAWLKDGICLQGFAEEMAGLPGKFAPPQGGLLIAFVDNEPAGCIAFRKFDDTTAEAKRFWVRPQFRKHGVGVALLKRMQQAVRTAGYQRMVFDTLPKMADALKLYDALGFKRIDSYYDNVLPGAMCFEKRF